MITHPLIETLKTAGQMSERVARHITAPYYGRVGIQEAGMIANALVEDHTGRSNQQDRHTASDRSGSVEARTAARQRMTMRTQIAEMILRFSDEYRDQLYASLVAGTGAQEAEALLETANAQANTFLAIVNSMVTPTVATA